MLNLKVGNEYQALMNRLSQIDEEKLTATDFYAVASIELKQQAID